MIDIPSNNERGARAEVTEESMSCPNQDHDELEKEPSQSPPFEGTADASNKSDSEHPTSLSSPSLLRLDPDRLLRQCQEDASRLMARRLRQQQLLQKQQECPIVMSPSGDYYYDHYYREQPSMVPFTIEITNGECASHSDIVAPGDDVETVSSANDLERVLTDEPIPVLVDCETPEQEYCREAHTPPEETRHPNTEETIEIDVDSNDDEASQFSTGAASDSDFSRYHLKVNPNQQDRAVDIPLYSFARPHMRAFHMSWLSFFVAFFLWFSMSPLLSEIAFTLHLTHEEIWTSSCLAVASSALTRILIGPLNDKYGARWVMSMTLIVAAVPSALSGWIIQDATSLYLVRFFIGVAGSAFVTSQYWTSSIFCVEIAGTANALTAGWGNLGGGVAQVVMGSVLFPIFKLIYGGSGFDHKSETFDYPSTEASNLPHNGTQVYTNDETNARASELAWRTVLVFPALAALIMAWVVLRFSDDTPKGNVSKRRDHIPSVSWSDNLWCGLWSRNTWLLFIQYGCCFGVEITMIQAGALYFKAEYGQSTESAAGIASVFGWMNLFARGLGGFLSDMANAKSGMRGRLWCQTLFLAIAGLLVIFFSFTSSLAGAIVVMIFFSVFVSMSEGSTFGIVPYVMPERTGSIAGWVGSGGNVGGVVFSLLFRSSNYRNAFLWMGSVVFLGSFCTALIVIPGHRALLYGKDSRQVYEHRRRAKMPDSIALSSSAVDEEADPSSLPDNVTA